MSPRELEQYTYSLEILIQLVWAGPGDSIYNSISVDSRTQSGLGTTDLITHLHFTYEESEDLQMG